MSATHSISWVFCRAQAVAAGAFAQLGQLLNRLLSQLRSAAAVAAQIPANPP